MASAVRPADSRQPAEEEDPGRDQADMEAGDRQQVNQPRPREPVLQLGIDPAPAAEDERVHHPGPRAIEAMARRVEMVVEAIARPGRLDQVGLARRPACRLGDHRARRAETHRARPGPARPACTGRPRGQTCLTRPRHRPLGVSVIRPPAASGRLQHSHAQSELPVRQARPRIAPLQCGRQLATRAVRQSAPAAGELGGTTREGDRDRQRRHADRAPKMQKAGRETGPIHGAKRIAGRGLTAARASSAAFARLGRSAAPARSCAARPSSRPRSPRGSVPSPD